MRIVETGDRAWPCDDLAMVVVQRLIARYGCDIVVVHGGCPGVDESFNKACKSLGVAVEVRLATWPQTGTPTIANRNRELIKPGADLCVALHQAIRGSQRTRDCVLQAIQAGIPTFLIEDERAVPVRLRPGDKRLMGRE
jgi:hypothetical protein